MSKHDDAEQVQVSYSSSSNISFRGKRSLGITWGEWREMTEVEQSDALMEFVSDLVDVGIVDDES